MGTNLPVTPELADAMRDCFALIGCALRDDTEGADAVHLGMTEPGMHQALAVMAGFLAADLAARFEDPAGHLAHVRTELGL